MPGRRPRAQHRRPEAPGDSRSGASETSRRAAASRRDQQARDQRRRQRAQHDRRAAPAVAKTVRPERVAAAAAALQPEPDDVKIIFGSQARIPPGAAHPRHTQGCTPPSIFLATTPSSSHPSRSGVCAS